MKNRPGEKIKLASLDELLGVVNEESAMEIEINKIHAFKNHPFKVLDDEKMQDLIESVKLSGVLTPVLLRVDSNDEYEMISGHRRLHAAKMAGLNTIPAIVRELRIIRLMGKRGTGLQQTPSLLMENSFI